MTRAVCALICLVASVALGAQTQQPPVPQPYPKVGQPQAPAKPSPPPATPATTAPLQAATSPVSVDEPSEATLGVPIYPSARFITSYDAGKGQRFFLFGTTSGFADVVAYYRSVLKQKGELVFDEPATHQFDLGRFREESMGFPPSVTVKDYTWGGMKGYPNPKPGAEPASYLTVVQVVPLQASPAPAPARR